MSDLPLPAPLDEYLGNPPTQPEPAELRLQLLSLTSLQIRRRRRVHLVKRGVVIFGMLSAACLTMIVCWFGVEWYRGLGELPAQQPHAQQPEPPPVQEKPQAPPEEKQPSPAAGKALPAAVAMEWQAFDAPASTKASLYMQAGDRYVADGHDLSAAVRCYGQAVQAAPSAALEIDPNDSWLVIALKIDQFEQRKEK